VSRHNLRATLSGAAPIGERRNLLRRLVAFALASIVACASTVLRWRTPQNDDGDMLLGRRWCDSTERALNDALMGRRSGFGVRGKF
jgi:hypothetical protein